MNKINTYLTKLIRFFSDCGRILTQNLQYPKLVIKDISECPAILSLTSTKKGSIELIPNKDGLSSE